MKIPMAIAELVAEFSGLNRTPQFKPVTNCPAESSGRTTPTPDKQQKYHGNRRQSTVITVGADRLPTVPTEPSSLRKSSRTSSGSTEIKFRKNRRQSAPCISTIASSTCLKEKMNRLRSANSSGDEQDDIQEEEIENGEDFHVKSRKQSVSYRIA
ncbi:unnamed protein product [Caenorhabditis brenneri]